jgi:hypothetical protein
MSGPWLDSGLRGRRNSNEARNGKVVDGQLFSERVIGSNITTQW